MTRRPWNYHSAVTCCETCGGTGRTQALIRPSAHDPFPEVYCWSCGGKESPPECKVCGNTVEILGHDCIACDLVDQLPSAALNFEEINIIVRAIQQAAVKRAQAGQVAA